ncbi:1253_t:CDS:2, partial [Cetraspora pellucida]
MSRIILVGVFLVVSISRVLARPYLSQYEDFDKDPVHNMNKHHPKIHDQLDLPFWVKVVLTVVLVLLGGLFADETNLHILATSGDSRQRKFASRIKPIRKNGHLLLVTLLLVNVFVNETLPIVMDDVMGGGGITAILVSSVLIVIFGEIIPQAVCSSDYHSLINIIANKNLFRPVRILMWSTYIVAYPIAKLLDRVLGENHGIIYRRA